MTEEKLREREEKKVALLPMERKQEKGKIQSPVYIREMTYALLSFVAGFFFGGSAFPMKGYPFGLALVTAVPKYPVLALAGIFLRVLYGDAYSLLPTAVAATGIVVLRFACTMLIYGPDVLKSVQKLPDTVLTKVLIGSIFTLGVSFYQLYQKGITVFGGIETLFFTVLTAAFALLFSFFLDRKYDGSPAYEAGFGAFAFALTLAFAPFSIGLFSIQHTVAFAIMLYAGFLGSPTRSSAVGLLTGLAVGTGYAPTLALAGLTCGILSETGAVVASLGAATVITCGTLYFGGASEVLAMGPELFVAVFCTVILKVAGVLPELRKKTEETAEQKEIAELLKRKKEEEKKKKLEKFASAMGTLSGFMHGFSADRMTLRGQTLAEDCKDIWLSHCADCVNAGSCPDILAESPKRVAGKLAEKLMTSGKIDRERLYEITKTTCPYLDSIAAETSARAAELLEIAMREDKTKLFAAEYEDMAKVFADAAAAGDIRLPIDKKASDKMARAFSEAHLQAENILVCGDRKKTVIATGEAVVKENLTPSRMRELCETVCKMPFSDPTYMLEEGSAAVMAESQPLFYVERAVKQLCKKGEMVSGDSVSYLVNDDDYAYTLLCDGMGSGEEAALTSSLCKTFLDNMLGCGNKKSTSLEILNHFLMARDTECFATVDLLEIDLVNGVASFLKSGAVPSYVIRDGHIYKIASSTFPIGIMEKVSMEVTEFALLPGDVILLCSDGVSSDIDSRERKDPTFLIELLEKEWTDDLDTMAGKIIAAADRITGRSDDMTVVFLRVKKAGLF